MRLLAIGVGVLCLIEGVLMLLSIGIHLAIQHGHQE